MMSGNHRDFEPDEAAFLRERQGAEPGARLCPDPARLQAFASQVLPDEQKGVIAAHLERCSACRLLVRDLEQWERPEPGPDELKSLRRRVQANLPSDSEAPARPRWGWWVWVAVPAAAGVLLVAALRPRMANAPAQPPPRLQASISAPGLDLKAVAPLEKAPIRLPEEALLVWRGGAAGGSAEMRELVAALEPYHRDDYSAAEQRLAEVASRQPRSFDARYYRGVSLLLLGRPQDAIEPLQQARALAPAAQAPNAAWYLAVAHLRSGAIGPARETLEPLCASRGERSAPACLALRLLAAPPAPK